MGRGRAKAKQTKVARQLKYSSGGTDLDRLRSELGVNDSRRNGAEEQDLDERYAAWADRDDDDEDEEEGTTRTRVLTVPTGVTAAAATKPVSRPEGARLESSAFCFPVTS